MESVEHIRGSLIRTITQRKTDLEYGLMREQPLADLLAKALQKKLQHSLYKWTAFDFYNEQKTFLIEIKNYRYSINKYDFEVIGVNKLITENLLLVFRHEDSDNEIYYIQYNAEQFKPFKRRYIGMTLCVDIPKDLLIKYYPTDKIKIKINKKEIDFVRKAIDKDTLLAEMSEDFS
tara:strand:+ start:658 stop:1185 length:528 start_codon:yes stop_codon:yes gene_type:complete